VGDLSSYPYCPSGSAQLVWIAGFYRSRDAQLAPLESPNLMHVRFCVRGRMPRRSEAKPR
jgi:hypothetical protein